MIKEDEGRAEEEALELLQDLAEGVDGIDPKFFTLKGAEEISDYKRTETLLDFLCSGGLVKVVKYGKKIKFFEVTQKGFEAYYSSLKSLSDSWDKGGESGP